MKNADLSTIYKNSLEALDNFSSISDCRTFNAFSALKSLEDLKKVRKDINKIFFVELKYQSDAQQDFLTENEMLCFVYCYYKNDHLTTLINLAYTENVKATLKNWCEMLIEVMNGFNKCLRTMSAGQYEPPKERTFSQMFGEDAFIDPYEFVNERVAAKLLKTGFLNDALGLAGFSAWDRYAYCLHLKTDLVKEEILPCLRKKTVLGNCNYKDGHFMALVYFANNSNILVQDVTFIQALNTVHNSRYPVLRNYNSLLTRLNEHIAELREELNLPVIEAYETTASAITAFCGITVNDAKVTVLLDFLTKTWYEKSLIKTEETLAVMLDRMC